MSAVDAVTLCALLVAIALGLYQGIVLRRRTAAPAPAVEHLGELVRYRVVAHTKDNRSIRGVLLATYPDCVVIDAPEYLGEPEVQQLAGRAVVLRPNLAWIQVLSDDGS